MASLVGHYAVLTVAFSVFWTSNAAVCQTDLDCSLNGVCDAGFCTCYAPWSGVSCGVMQFKPVEPIQGYGMLPNVTSWGGNIVQWKGLYHLFVAEIVEGCTITYWQSNSRVTHAVSTTPTGPFKFSDIALDVWSHNPQIAVQEFAENTTFALFHIGSGEGGKPHNCSVSELEPKPKVATSVLQEPLKDRQSTLHVALSPYGPWEPVLPAPPDCNNPAPLLLPNGTWFLLCDSVAMYTAPTLWGPWKFVMNIPQQGGVPGSYEDAFMYIDQRNNWHILYHVYNATTPCDQCSGWMVSAHTYSTDGLNWMPSPIQPFTNQYNRTDGTTVTISTRERPKLLFDQTGQETHLITGVCSAVTCPPTPGVNCKYDWWDYTLVQPLAI